MNASNGAVEPGFGAQPLRIPPPPPPRAAQRALHLVPSPPPLEIAEAEEPPPWPDADGDDAGVAADPDPIGAQAAATATDLPPLAEPASAEAELPTPQPLIPQGDAALEVATLRLRRELAEVQEEVAALQEMLQELPTIFERKFQQRLRKVVDQQRLLEADNRSLRRRLLALAPGGDPDALPLRPHGLLPPSVRTALKLRQQEALEAPLLSGAEPTTDGSADPTRR